MVYGSHEVRPEQDVDQTFHPNWHTEQRRREERNIELKRMLLAGSDVAYRSSGRSLEPRVMNGDRCTFEPVTSVDQVLVDDIVFCEVQYGDRFYVGVVREKRFDGYEDCYYFFIGSIKGRFLMNNCRVVYGVGWCKIGHVYGRLSNVDQ